MKRRAAPLIALVLLVTLALGCGSDKNFEAAPPFQKKKDIAIWATTGSAVAVYTNGYQPFGVADGELTYSDPACPTVTDDGTTLNVAGGCTDVNEREWNGWLTVRRDGEDRTLDFHEFDGIQGTMHLRRLGPSEREFDAELTIGAYTTIDYSGRIEGDYVGPTTWNGSGSVERDGFLPPTGTVEVTTEVQVVDDAVCSGQPASGTTTLRARGEVAVITYDGVTDCDGDKNAGLSVNGEDRGLIAGINCALAGVGRRAPFDVSGCAFGLITLLAWRRRRR